MLGRTARIFQLLKSSGKESYFAEDISKTRNEDPYEFVEDDSSSKTEFVRPSRSSECESAILRIDKHTTKEFTNFKIYDTCVLSSNSTVNLQFDEESPEICLQEKVNYYLQSLPATQKDSNEDSTKFNKMNDDFDGHHIKGITRNLFKDESEGQHHRIEGKKGKDIQTFRELVPDSKSGKNITFVKCRERKRI